MTKRGAYGNISFAAYQGRAMHTKKDFLAPCSETYKGERTMYAIIETGGKQYKVEANDVVFIEKLDVESDSEIVFDKVIAVAGDDGIKVGAPYVEGASVKAKVIKNGKAKKITVMTYKSKKNEKRKLGHRQPYTKVEIVSVNA